MWAILILEKVNTDAAANVSILSPWIKKQLKNIAKDGLEKGAEEIAMNMASSSPSQKAVGTGIKQAVGKNLYDVHTGRMASAAAAVSGRYQSLKPKV